MEASSSNSLRLTSNSSIFEFSLEMPVRTPGALVFHRDYRETIQGEDGEERFNAAQERVKVAIENVASELKVDASKIKPTIPPGQPGQFEKYFPFTPKLTPQMTPTSPQFTQVEKGLVLDSQAEENRHLPNSFSLDTLDNSAILDASQRRLSAAFSYIDSTDGFPRLHSKEQIFDEMVVGSSSGDEHQSVKEDLVVAGNTILKHVMEMEKSASEGVIGQKEKRACYREYQLICEDALEAAESIPDCKEKETLRELHHWLYFHEIQNTTNVIFASWDEINHYLRGAKEEFVQHIQDKDKRKAFQDQLDQLSELLTEKYEIKDSAGQFQRRISESLHPGTEQAVLLGRLLEDDQCREMDVTDQILPLANQLYDQAPSQLQPVWDPFLKSVLLSHQMLILREKREYIPATLRFEFFESIRGLYEDEAHASFEFKRELFCVGLFEPKSNEENYFETFSHILMNYLSVRMSLELCCKHLDQVESHFEFLHNTALFDDKAALDLAIGKVTQDINVQNALQATFQALQAISLLPERILTLEQQCQKIIPTTHQLMYPSFTNQERENLIAQLGSITNEVKTIQDENLVDFCDSESYEGFTRLAASLAFCRMQINAPPLTGSIHPLIDICHNYLDVITQGKWNLSHLLEQRSNLQNLSREMAKIKKEDAYQNLDDAASLEPTIQRIQHFKDLQRQLIAKIVIDSASQEKEWVQSFLELECILLEKSELKHSSLKDEQLEHMAKSLLRTLSPLLVK